MKYITISAMLCLLAIVSCKKDNGLSEREYAMYNCLKASTKNNPSDLGTEYADFVLNQKHVIMSDGFNNYKQTNDIKYTAISGPGHSGSKEIWIGFENPTPEEISPGISQLFHDTDDQLYLSIGGGAGLSLTEFVDSKFKVGELPLQTLEAWDSPNRDSTDAFVLSYWCVCDCADYNPEGSAAGWFRFATISPEQSGSVYCTKMERTDLGDKVRYQMQFKMDCDLFSVQNYKLYYVDHLKGHMAVDFTLDK